jgi:hypothetical protein
VSGLWLAHSGGPTSRVSGLRLAQSGGPTSRVSGLRLAQSGVPTARVSVLSFLPEDGRSSSFRNVTFYFYINLDDG